MFLLNGHKSAVICVVSEWDDGSHVRPSPDIIDALWAPAPRIAWNLRTMITTDLKYLLCSNVL